MNSSAALQTLLRERGFSDSDNRFLRVANDFLTQTGLRFNRNLAFLTGLALGGVYFVILNLAFGFGLLTLAFAVIATAATAFLFLAMVRRKRIARFGEQLPDAIDVIVRGVRVGFPFSAAMDLVAREMADPVGAEFGICPMKLRLVSISEPRSSTFIVAWVKKIYCFSSLR